MWVRGLKHVQPVAERTLQGVAPRVGAWIETFIYQQYKDFRQSHPVWVRGLKPRYYRWVQSDEGSHPVWVRGLKHWKVQGQSW